MLWFLIFLFQNAFTKSLPEETMSTPEIISYYGYPVEIITVTTDDGYILALHRIPFGKNETKKTRDPNRPVIFLQHGLLASSADFVANLPHQSLGFMLADAGFDVWLGNSRGNFYSQRHTKFDSNSPAFWNFTWDEIVAYDMPAQVNRVLEITGASSLHYVGHSQGTMVMFARLANYPDFHSKIKSFFALAPVATVGNIKGLLRIISDHFQKELRWLIEMQGEHQFLPTTWFSRMTARIICGTFAMLNPLCQNILFQIGGPENKQFNMSRIMVYMSHTPAGTSTSNILHWAQMVQSGKTQMFDYGSAQKNLWRYGQETPPAYNMSTFIEPTYLYYGDADWLADVIDVEALVSEMNPECKVVVKKLPGYNHFDFIYGLRAPADIYENIIMNIKREHKKGKMLRSNRV